MLIINIVKRLFYILDKQGEKMYTYTEFASNKIRRTKGKFCGWTEPMGILNVRYAIFRNRCSEILVPIYCLTKETKERISNDGHPLDKQPE